MKIELNAPERATAMRLLPSESSFLTMKLVRETKLQLGLTDEEYKAFVAIDADGNGTFIDAAIKSAKQFEFGETVMMWIKDALVKLNEKNKLTIEHLALYEKFVEIKAEE